MPNIKSVKKDVLRSRDNREKNRIAKSVLRTSLKKFNAAVESGDKAQASAAYTAAVKTIDMSATKGIIHKNNAARKKSSITLKYNAMA